MKITLAAFGICLLAIGTSSLIVANAPDAAQAPTVSQLLAPSEGAVAVR